MEALLNQETDQTSAKIVLKVSIALQELTLQLNVLMDIVQQTVNHQLCVRMELTDQLTLSEWLLQLIALIVQIHNTATLELSKEHVIQDITVILVQ